MMHAFQVRMRCAPIRHLQLHVCRLPPAALLPRPALSVPVVTALAFVHVGARCQPPSSCSPPIPRRRVISPPTPSSRVGVSHDAPDTHDAEVGRSAGVWRHHRRCLCQ